MHYLVTGAAGFIGAAVAQKLISKGNQVDTIDNLSTGYKEHVPNGVKLIEGSVFDNSVFELLRGQKYDAIIHIAGQSSGEISFENPVYDFQTNGQSTLMLLDYARRTGCNKFIYASTMSVYGDQADPQCDENKDIKPKSLYAVGKIASENYMRIYSQQYGIVCTALRLFNTYGIGQNMKNMKQGMASIYLAMALKEQKILVRGSKERFRDFVYIDDVVNAFCLSLNRESGYDCYNVCTGKKIRVEEIINLICCHLPYAIEVEYVEGTIGDQFGIYGNNRKIKENLGWEPKVNFDDGLNRMIDWAVSNQDNIL